MCIDWLFNILFDNSSSYALEKMQNFGLCWVCSVSVTCEQGGTTIVLLCCMWHETNASFAVSSRRTAPFGCFLMASKWAWKLNHFENDSPDHWTCIVVCEYTYLLLQTALCIINNTTTLQSLKTLHHEYDIRQAW